MNALSRTVVNRLPRVAANTRAMSTSTGPVPYPSFVPAQSQPSFSKKWLSDAGTYPVMFILVVANVVWTSFITYKFTYCPNVRYTSKTRGKIIRDWS
ncbi:hypothetical protein ACA910_000873 [Epithemia clementina (nom. ined.)]